MAVVTNITIIILGLVVGLAHALQLFISSANYLVDSSPYGSLLLLLETQRGRPEFFPALAAILRSDKGATQSIVARSAASWREEDFMLLLEWVLHHFKPLDSERELFFPTSAISSIKDPTMRKRVSLALLREGLSGGITLLKDLSRKDDPMDDETLRAILRPEFAEQVDFYGLALFKRIAPLPPDIDWALFAGATLFRTFSAQWSAKRTQMMIPLLVQAPLLSLARLAIRERINNDGLYDHFDELGWIQWKSRTCTRLNEELLAEKKALSLNDQEKATIPILNPMHITSTFPSSREGRWALLISRTLLCSLVESDQTESPITTVDLFRELISAQASNREILTLLEMASIMLSSLEHLLDSLQLLSGRAFNDVGALEMEHLAGTLFYRHPHRICQRVMQSLGQDFFKLLMYDPLVYLVLHQDQLKRMPFAWKLSRYRRWNFSLHTAVSANERTGTSLPLMTCDQIDVYHFQPRLNLPCKLTPRQYHEILESLISRSAPMIIYDAATSTMRPLLGYTEGTAVTVQVLNALILGMVRFGTSPINIEPTFCALLGERTKLPAHPEQSSLLKVDSSLVLALVNDGSRAGKGKGKRKSTISITWYMHQVHAHLAQLKGAIRGVWEQWSLNRYFPGEDICTFIQTFPPG